MKKLICAVVCLLIAAAPILSLAESGPVFSYTPAEGSQMLTVTEFAAMEAPKGLDGLYSIMGSAGNSQFTALFPMKNGRAVISLSVSQIPEDFTVQSLMELWPAIAQTLSGEMAYVNNDTECVSIETRFEHEALVIKTNGVVGDEDALLIDLTGIAFTDGNVLTEIWAAAPSDTAYLFDEEANAELISDRNDMEAVLSSFGFKEMTIERPELKKPEIEYETEHYADPKGRFETDIIKDCIIITAETDKEEALALRERLVERFGSGAGKMFDINYKDVIDEDSAYITLPDLSGAVCIYRVPVFESNAGVTAQALLLNNDGTIQSLTGKYGKCTGVLDNGIITISGVDHAWTDYLLESDETKMFLELMCMVEDDGNLRELDVFKMSDNADNPMCDALMYTVVNTMRYTKPE